ncbi:MAG: hypothetical protein FWF86_09115 [Clostridia bacterium]|nr:hypothetical protein [Clostridia bacterium]
MIASIVGIWRYPRKGEPGEPMLNIDLLQGIGLKGDFPRGGKRQVSILAAEARRWMDTQAEKGLCFRRFRENLLVEGLALEELGSGVLLSVGKAVLQITGYSKGCYDGCPLLLKNRSCRLAGCVCFADVVQSGIVRLRDVVSIYSPLHMERGDSFDK